MSIWRQRLKGAAVLKGGIDCSSNPNYPAAVRGDTYTVTVAGKIGGASGIAVDSQDQIQCIVDTSPAGTHAAVGANWVIVQGNVINGVTSSSTPAGGDNIPLFDGVSGKIIKDSSKSIVTVIGSDDTTIPTSLAVKNTGHNNFASRDVYAAHPVTSLSGLLWRSVRCATTGNITIATALVTGQVIDGITLVAGDRVLVWQQTDEKENGIYTAGAVPVRATNSNSDVEIRSTIVRVQDGTVNYNKIIRNTNATTITVGGTNITYVLCGETISILVDGNGFPLTSGAKTPPRFVPYNCRILGWSVRASDSDTITADLEYSATLGGALSSITGAGTKPNIAAAVSASGSNLSGWGTTTLIQGMPIGVNLSGTLAAATWIMVGIDVIRM